MHAANSEPEAKTRATVSGLRTEERRASATVQAVTSYKVYCIYGRRAGYLLTSNYGLRD